MKSTRRQFLQTSALTTVAGAIPASSSSAGPPKDGELDAFQIARRHLIVRDVPGPDFFEGMLLGNGDVGVCAVVRPDALGLHIGKSDSWDIRVSEDIEKYIL
ncbi:MAG: twin-arginine translocation signal domain-containing protein, partial [Terriglobia bacterium]